MALARALAPLRRLAAGVLLALPLACLQVGAGTSRTELAVAGMVLECPIGSAGCSCTPGGGCDPGLICVAGTCSYEGDAMGGEIMYEFEDDLAPLAPAPSYDEVTITSSSPGRAGKLGGKRDKARKKEAREFSKQVATGAVAPAEAAAPVMLEPVDVAGNDAAANERTSTDEPDDEGRQIVYTASLQVAVFELDAAIELAESLPDRYGGWIEYRYNYQITLRLPAERLFDAIEQLSALGVVLGKTLRADDVTDEYTDLESRILVLEQMVEQLELLLKQAKTVEEALKIRVELDRVRLELESARTRMRQLSELIDFSTLTLYLSARGPVDPLPSSNDPFPWVNDLGVEATEYR